MISCAPAPLVSPVVLLSRQIRYIVTIDVGHNHYIKRIIKIFKGLVFWTVGRYQFSFVKWIFRTGKPNHDGDRKTSGVMTQILKAFFVMIYQDIKTTDIFSK